MLYTDSVKGTTDVLHAAEYAVQQAPVRCALFLGAVVLHSSKWAALDVISHQEHAVLCCVLLQHSVRGRTILWGWVPLCLPLRRPSTCCALACIQLVLCCPDHLHAGCKPCAKACLADDMNDLRAALFHWNICANISNNATCRQRVLFFLDHLHTGDKLDFIVWPKDDHDCDAALLLEAKIWDSSEFKETTTF